MKFKKIGIGIGIVCICGGAVLTGIGLGLGGTLHSGLGVNFGNGFFGLGFSEGAVGDQTIPLKGEFDTVKFDISMGDITIVRGTSWKLHVKDAPEDEYSIEQNDDTLAIVSKSKQQWFNFNFGVHDYAYTLTIPVGVELNTMDVSSDMGDVVIEDLEILSLTVDQSMGDVELKKVTCEDLKIDQSIGDINYDGARPGNVDVHNSMGDIEFIIDDAMKHYRYDLSTSMGSIKTNQERQSGVSETLSGGNKNAQYHIEMDSSMGDIELEFSDDGY